MEHKELLEQLKKVVNESEKSLTVMNNNLEWKTAYDNLCQTLINLCGDARHDLDVMKSKSLTANTIEAEGFLRCALTVCDVIKDHDNIVNQKRYE